MKTYAYCRVSTQRQSLARQIENVTKVYPDAIIYSDKFTGSTLNRPNWQKLYKLLKKDDVLVCDSVSRLSRDAESGVALYMELYERGVDLRFLNEPWVNSSEYRKAATDSLPMNGDEIADIYIEATNKVLMILAKRQIVIAFQQAEKERQDICKRVTDGMAAKKREAAKRGEVVTYGAIPGKKLNVKKEAALKALIRKHNRDFDGDLSDSETLSVINGKDRIELEGGTEIKPHVGLTDDGNPRARYLSRNTYYAYKRQMKE